MTAYYQKLIIQKQLTGKSSLLWKFPFSTTTTKEYLQKKCRTFTTSSYSFKGEKLRVAVIGGGCAGLSSALHLAPLVEEGIIAGPIDIYDPGPTNARDIGVGIWSTALDPFLYTHRPSHEMVYNNMTKIHGTWLGDVGYRTPDGTWLMKSHLPKSKNEADTLKMPGLLFLREKDLISTLQKAIHLEAHNGTIQVHHSRVIGLYEESSKPWSTNLLLASNNRNNNSNNNNNNMNEDIINRQTMSEHDYHFIIAADGMNSIIRSTYGGHESGARRLTGTSALPSPLDLPPGMTNYDPSTWDQKQHRQAVAIQDRNYNVFRGNAHITREELGNHDDISFQTWGTGKSMRFATVPMMYPTPKGKVERQVWFITTDRDDIANEPDLEKRRDLLVNEFKDWHDPICRTVLATPPDEILMERAIAHRHCMGPVLSFNTNVIRQIRGKRPPSSGEGPCIVFVGDAFMTVDPILAQGFTVGMEGAAALRNSVEKSCIPNNNNNNNKDDDLSFDPVQLRRELKIRQVTRMDRLICLLRATELVQALGQPSASTTISGFLNTKLLRPLTRLTPNFIKAPLFDAILKYSLGLGLFRTTQSDTIPTTSMNK